jgi:hypothetical protein
VGLIESKKSKILQNKTENSFSLGQDWLGKTGNNEKAAGLSYSRLKKYFSAGRLPAVCRPGLRPVIKLVLFLQGCRARQPGKEAGQGSRARSKIILTNVPTSTTTTTTTTTKQYTCVVRRYKRGNNPVTTIHGHRSCRVGGDPKF